MLESRLAQQFFDASDLLAQWAEPLATPQAAAVDLLVHSLTAGARLVVGGSLGLQGEAQALVAQCLGQGARDRPGLPAVLLGGDWSLQAGLLQGAGSWASACSRPLQALGQAGDVLVLMLAEDALLLQAAEGIEGAVRSAGQPSHLRPEWEALVEQAHGQDMAVLVWALGAPLESGPAVGLWDTDGWIPLAPGKPAQARLLLRWSWQCVADAIDAQLLGDAE